MLSTSFSKHYLVILGSPSQWRYNTYYIIYIIYIYIYVCYREGKTKVSTLSPYAWLPVARCREIRFRPQIPHKSTAQKTTS